MLRIEEAIMLAIKTGMVLKDCLAWTEERESNLESFTMTEDHHTLGGTGFAIP